MAIVQQEHIAVLPYSVHREFIAPYDIKAAKAFSFDIVYAFLAYDVVQKEHVALFKNDSSEFSHDSVWSLQDSVSFEHVIEYNLLEADLIKTEHVATYRMDTSAFEHVSTWSILQTLAKEHVSEWSLENFEKIRQEHEAVYGMAGSAFEHVSAWDLLGSLSKEHVSVYSLTSPLAVEFVAVYEMKDHDVISREHGAVYNIYDPIVIDVTGQPVITLGDGTIVDIIDADVSKSEDQIHWTCTITLGDVSDYQLFEQDTPFELDLFGEKYDFIVDSKELNRGEGTVNRNALVNGVSPTALADSPRASQREYTFATSKTLITMMQEILSGVGITLNQVGTITDGLIPFERAGVRAASPLEVVFNMATKAGLVIYAPKQDPGVLNIRRKYLYDTHTGYTAGNTSSSVTDMDNIMRLVEQFVPSRLVDRVRIFDSQGTFKDKITFELDTDNAGNRLAKQGTARIYPSPAREALDNPVLDNVNKPEIKLEFLGQETETIEGEELTFNAGIASVDFPINSMVSIDWQGVSLVGVTYEPGSSTIRGTDTSTNGGYAVAIVSYTTISRKYRVIANTEEAIDLLLSYQD